MFCREQNMYQGTILNEEALLSVNWKKWIDRTRMKIIRLVVIVQPKWLLSTVGK